MGRRWVSRVSTKLLWGSLLHEDLLLVLLDDLVVLQLSSLLMLIYAIYNKARIIATLLIDLL